MILFAGEKYAGEGGGLPRQGGHCRGHHAPTWFSAGSVPACGLVRRSCGFASPWVLGHCAALDLSQTFVGSGQVKADSTTNSKTIPWASLLEYGLVVQAKRENYGETGNSRAT